MHITGNKFTWSGLMSNNFYSWQHGLRTVSRDIGEMLFIPSSDTGSGYEHWLDVARHLIDTKPKAALLMGHSNGGFAITSIAKELKPHGIKCWLISWDRTLKPCPPVGSNVDVLVDIWAGLEKIDIAPDFKGVYKLHDFRKETHLSVVDNRQAQAVAIDMGKRFREIYG